MRFRSFAVLIAAATAGAACRAPKPLQPGQFEVAPQYAMLFRPYQGWTYHVANTQAAEADDEDAHSVVVRCKADKVVPFSGGVTSHIHCNMPQDMAEDTGAFPLEGIWMANASGVWHVHANATPTLDNATLLLAARPEEGHVPPEDLTGDDQFAEVAKDGDAWCTTHKQQLDVEVSLTLCFAPEGVRSGKYGWKDSAVHETRFELARDGQ
jgi:hypothetical protein